MVLWILLRRVLLGSVCMSFGIYPHITYVSKPGKSFQEWIGSQNQEMATSPRGAEEADGQIIIFYSSLLGHN